MSHRLASIIATALMDRSGPGCSIEPVSVGPCARRCHGPSHARRSGDRETSPLIRVNSLILGVTAPSLRRPAGLAAGPEGLLSGGEFDFGRCVCLGGVAVRHQTGPARLGAGDATRLRTQRSCADNHRAWHMCGWLLVELDNQTLDWLEEVVHNPGRPILSQEQGLGQRRRQRDRRPGQTKGRRSTC